MSTSPFRSLVSAPAWSLSVLTTVKLVPMTFFTSSNCCGLTEFSGTTSATRKCGRPPLKLTPNNSRIRKGPRIKLKISLGWRKTSLTSLRKKADMYVSDLNMAIPLPV